MNYFTPQSTKEYGMILNLFVVLLGSLFMSHPVLADLPQWSLNDLYASNADPKIQADIAYYKKLAKEFHDRYEGKLLALQKQDVLTAIKQFESISEGLSRLQSYAFLQQSTAQADPERTSFMQKIVEETVGISSQLIFFPLALNQRDDLVSDATLAPYKSWLKNLVKAKPHQLSDVEEKLLHEKEVTGAFAWNKLYDQILAKLEFNFDGRKATLNEVLNEMQNPDGAKRREAALALTEGLKNVDYIIVQIYNTLIKDYAIDNKFRKFNSPVSARNLDNQIEDEVVQALVRSVRESYPQLTHRFYKLKTKLLKKSQLEYWDRNAPLPDQPDTTISWAEARKIVLESLQRFSPEMAKIGQKFFDNPWIDAKPRPGKRSGAFAHPTVPSAHPYLFLNYHGKLRDVMTLAHELGHTIHMDLARAQGHLQCDAPLTLAETASVFGEMLTFRALLNQTTDKATKRALLAEKINDMLNTVARQIAIFTFEEKAHAARTKGELTPKELEDIWMETQRESLGDSVHLDDAVRVYWAYISHVFHVPFYVYSYAFGDCLVNSLYAIYLKNPEGFQEKYINMLKAGGSKHHKELLAPFGLDASDPDFWKQGLQMISDLIDELEQLMDQA
jgi:oligoendopeptidase F